MARFRYIYGAIEDVVIGKEESACIVRNSDGKSWRLIRLDEDASIKVNGEEVHLVCYLAQGDRIDLSDETETLRFSTRDASSSLEKELLSRRIRRLGIFSTVAASIIIVAFISLFKILGNDRQITRKDLVRYEESICKISVTRAEYQQVTLTEYGQQIATLDEVTLENQAGSGSGFFTTDGRLITARHCVEPWITDPDPLNNQDNAMIRWAAESETFNASPESSDSLFRRVISYCEVFCNGAKIHEFSTDTCRFSIENDLVRNLRGRLDPLYWRELGDINRPSSLGDIAVVQTNHRGKLAIASEDLMKSLKAERKAAHLGYEKDQTKINFESSKLKYDPIRKDSEIIRCLEHVSVEMAQGFSGSPVLVKEDGKFYVIGIVSKTKNASTSSFFSVPVTELVKTCLRWNE